MKQSFKVWVSMLLVCVLLLSACGNTGDSGANDNGDKTTTTSKDTSKDSGDAVVADSICTPKGEFPIVKEGEEVTLTVTVFNKNTDDFDNNVFTQYMEEKTGINLEFNVLNYADATEQLNLMMMSGDYTDVILGIHMSREEQSVYAQDGMLIPLNDLYYEYGDDLKKAIELYGEEEELIKYFALEDGQMYGVSNFVESYHTKATNKMWIYEPWLEALDLEVPQTTDEFYEVLKAFKEQDPNGNGIADEVPLAAASKGWNTQIDKFLMNAFEFNYTQGNDNMYLDADNNYKVTAAMNTKGWKEGLEYIHRLYDEGLMVPESLTQDNKQLKLLGENEISMLGAAPGGTVAEFTQAYGESGRWLEYVSVPILESPEGRRKNFSRQTKFDQYRAYITDKCENPDVAYRFIDLLLNEDVNKMGTFGIEGVDWSMAEEGELGLNGEQGVIKINQRPDRVSSWSQCMPELQTSSLRIGRVYEKPHLEHVLYEATKDNYIPFAATDEMLPKDLIYSEDESTELVDLRTNINTYVEEMTARFIIGDASIEKEWDNYVKELENIGIERYVEIIQGAYDRRYGQ